MTNKWAYALHELQFVDDDKKKTVAPKTTVSLPKGIYDDFFGLNAVRPATDDEIAAAKAKSGEGVTEAPVAPTAAEIEAAKEAAAKQAAADDAKAQDAKTSAAAAAESDRNREAAKTAKPGKSADKPADPLA